MRACMDQSQLQLSTSEARQMGFLEGAEHSSGKQGQTAHFSLGTHHRQPTSLLQTTNIHMSQMNGLRSRKERDRDSASLSKVITLLVGNVVLMFEHSWKVH